MTYTHKPIGGVESVALYPTNAVESVLFSSRGCEVSFVADPIDVELLENSSYYEEKLTCKNGTAKITHRVVITAEREWADRWLSNKFLERASMEGLVAKVKLCDGRNLLVGYSAHFGDEQPLRLESLLYNSGRTPHDRPTVTLTLLSHDTAFSQTIL